MIARGLYARTDLKSVGSQSLDSSGANGDPNPTVASSKDRRHELMQHPVVVDRASRCVEWLYEDPAPESPGVSGEASDDPGRVGTRSPVAAAVLVAGPWYVDASPWSRNSISAYADGTGFVGITLPMPGGLSPTSPDPSNLCLRPPTFTNPLDCGLGRMSTTSTLSTHAFGARRLAMGSRSQGAGADESVRLHGKRTMCRAPTSSQCKNPFHAFATASKASWSATAFPSLPNIAVVIGGATRSVMPHRKNP
jgi:hypothetical protein